MQHSSLLRACFVQLMRGAIKPPSLSPDALFNISAYQTTRDNAHGVVNKVYTIELPVVSTKIPQDCSWSQARENCFQDSLHLQSTVPKSVEVAEGKIVFSTANHKAKCNMWSVHSSVQCKMQNVLGRMHCTVRNTHPFHCPSPAQPPYQLNQRHSMIWAYERNCNATQFNAGGLHPATHTRHQSTWRVEAPACSTGNSTGPWDVRRVSFS